MPNGFGPGGFTDSSVKFGTSLLSASATVTVPITVFAEIEVVI